MQNFLKFNKIIITTPIYYMNNEPHIGHLYTNILADSIKKILKINYPKKEIFLQSGSDYHGIKIQKSVKNSKIKYFKDYCDIYDKKFSQLNEDFNIDIDSYVRTIDEKHIELSKLVFKNLYDKNEIKLNKYEGYYDYREERFIKDYENQNIYDKKFIEKTTEMNYTLDLLKNKEFLENLLKSTNFINDKNLKKYMLKELSNSPEFISISRSIEKLSWGIKTPIDTNQIIYVWFEALLNYLSLGYDNRCTSFADIENNLKNTGFLHLIGHDILRFHSILYPLILILSKENYDLTNNINLKIHYHYIINNLKLSKSYDNIIKPYDILNKYKDTDMIRIYFLAEGPEKKDQPFKFFKIKSIYNNFNDKVFNFFSRILNNKILNDDKEFSVGDETFLNNPEFKEINDILISFSLNNGNINYIYENIINLFNKLNYLLDDSQFWHMEHHSRKYLLKKLFVIIGKSIDYISILTPNYVSDLKTVLEFKHNKVFIVSKNIKKIIRNRIP